MKKKIINLFLLFSFIGLSIINGYAQTCTDFPTPQVTKTNPTSFDGGTITITNLPAGASSSINDGVFTLGKTVYDGLGSTIHVVRMKLNGCETRKFVLLDRLGGGSDRNVCYKIVNKATGKALDVKGNSKADGASIVQWQVNGGTNQLWRIVDLYASSFIYSVSSEKAITQSRCTPGTAIIQSELQYLDTSQRWSLAKQGDGSFKLNFSNALCPASVALRVQNNSAADGAIITSGTDDGSDFFKWILAEVPCPSTTSSTFDPTRCYTLTARHSNKVMEIATSSPENGINIQQNTLAFTLNQFWRIKPVGGTFYRVMNGYGGGFMDVKGGSTADGANIQQYQNNGDENQLWRFDKNSEGYYVITAKHSGKAIDVKGISTADGANIQQYTKNGGANQQWLITDKTCPSGTVPLLASQIYTADGYREANKSIITWVSNAADADYFTVEKMDKNGNFETLDKINAKPISAVSDKNYYVFNDNQPFEGENTYRISLTTDNAPPQYSNVISLNFNKTMDFTLYPNPTSAYIDVDLKPYENRPVVLSIMDATGHEMRSLSVEKAGKTQRIDLDGFTNGLYLLRIHTAGKRDVARLFNRVY
jgi:Ricin-type beta-trefoil lectin domain-like/Secretion system C-terminal sorting domain